MGIFPEGDTSEGAFLTELFFARFGCSLICLKDIGQAYHVSNYWNIQLYTHKDQINYISISPHKNFFLYIISNRNVNVKFDCVVFNLV